MKNLLIALGLLTLTGSGWALTPTNTPTFTVSPSDTLTVTPSATPTDTPTATLTPTQCGSFPAFLGPVDISDTGINATHYTRLYTAPGGINTILVVNAELYAVSQPSILSMTYNGIAMTHAVDGSGVPGVPAGTDTQIETWYLLNPSTVTGNGVVINSSHSCQFEVAIMTFTNASGIGTSGSFTFTGSSFSQSISPIGNNSLLETFAQTNGNRITMGTPPIKMIYQNPDFNAQPMVGAISNGPALAGGYNLSYTFGASLSAGALQLVEILSSASGCNTPTVTSTATPTNSPAATLTLTVTPSNTQTFTASPTPSASPTVTASPTPGGFIFSNTGIFQEDYAPYIHQNDVALGSSTAWVPFPLSATAQPYQVYVGNNAVTAGQFEFYDFEPTTVTTPMASLPLAPGTAVKLYPPANSVLWVQAAVTAQPTASAKVLYNQ